MATILNSTLRIGPALPTLSRSARPKSRFFSDLIGKKPPMKLHKPKIQHIALKSQYPELHSKILRFYEDILKNGKKPAITFETQVKDLKKSLLEDKEFNTKIGELKKAFNEGWSFEFTEFPIAYAEYQKTQNMRHGSHKNTPLPATQFTISAIMLAITGILPREESALLVKTSRDPDDHDVPFSPYTGDLGKHTDGGSGGEWNRITLFIYLNDANQKTYVISIDSVVACLLTLEGGEKALEVLQQPFFSCGSEKHKWALLSKDDDDSPWDACYSENFDFDFSPDKSCNYSAEEAKHAIELLKKAMEKACESEHNIERFPSISAQPDQRFTSEEGLEYYHGVVFLMHDSKNFHFRPLDQIMDFMRALLRMNGFKPEKGDVEQLIGDYNTQETPARPRSTPSSQKKKSLFLQDKNVIFPLYLLSQAGFGL